MEYLEDLEDEGSPLCFNCAQRLGKYTWPDIPELLFGYCPQCGGTRALNPARNAAALPQSRGSKTEVTRKRQVA